jgi:PAS domain S-box-containing protein
MPRLFRMPRAGAEAEDLLGPGTLTQNDGEMASIDAQGLVLGTLLMEAIESAQMAVCVYDERGRYVTVNECACKILGQTREELLAHDVGDFTEGGIDRQVLFSNEHREGVRLVKRKDGSTVPCGFIVTPTRVGHLPYFVAVWWTLDDDDPRAAAAR